MKQISPTSLIDLKALADERKIPLRTQMVYAGPDNFLGEAIYRPGARLWLHADFAQIVVQAAGRMAREHNLFFVVTDGLRTVDAQRRMLETARARQNPQWYAQGMLSGPGKGGHQRGMAVDIVLEDARRNIIDMGTPLDDMSEKSARAYTGLPAAVLERRRLLEALMQEAAVQLAQPLYPLPGEWWDFRFPPEVFEQYAPLSDADLPPEMRLCL